MAIPFVNLTGRLTDDPELRYTQSGKAVASMRIAENDSRYNEQTREWENTNVLFVTVSVWEQLGERAAQSLGKGDSVFLNGKFMTRQWQDKDGNNRSTIEFTAREVRPLGYLPRLESNGAPGNAGGNTGGWNNTGASNTGGFGGGNTGGGNVSNDPWGSAPAATGNTGADSEPPF